MSDSIRYFSTNGKAVKVSFSEALLKGLAPDKGLYIPDHIPSLSTDQLNSMIGKEYPFIANTIASHLLSDEIDKDSIQRIVTDAYDYPVPLEQVYDRKYILRLDQGPTASFKDFAARMMGRLMQHFLQKENRTMLILTATSGDTGSAIANAFYGLDNIKVVILFPENEVTDRQRKQMTTLRKNITILSLNGKFDDCQALVKQAFTDPDLDTLKLSSANSINIGRLLPQSFYYFYAWSQLARNAEEPVIFSVPSGNFGNMMGALLAKKMGLPIGKLVISTNENDEVPVYWKTGQYKTIVPSRNCISSAMNVGHPSNMARVVSLYGGVMDEKGTITTEPDVEALHRDIFTVSITDAETEQTIRDVYRNHRVLLEPHGAAGWGGLQYYFKQNPRDSAPGKLAISLETAHPAKFPQEIRSLLGIEPELPASMKDLEKLDESFDRIHNDYKDFKQYLLSRYL
ncbi:MAG TPA: threonine synthase [Bacteroidales bacterium]|nr:threonine synthase [Bacteroidales bacterium]